MKRLIIFAVVLLAAVGGTSSAVLGGTSESFFDVDPTSAPPGGTVTVTGVCPVDDVNQWEGVFFYLDIPDAMDDEPEFFHLDNFPITPGVQWTFGLTIPAEARPGETTIAKQCARLNDDGSFGGGEGTQRLDFVVLEPAPDTTEPTDPADTVPPPSEPTATTAPATQPRFTG